MVCEIIQWTPSHFKQLLCIHTLTKKLDSLALVFCTLHTNNICLHYIGGVITIPTCLMTIGENNGIIPMGPTIPFAPK